MALFLSIALPAVLFIASLMRLLGCVKRRGQGMLEYVWATGYTMVVCLSSTWLAADLASMENWALSAERAELVMKSGPPFFVALACILVLRPVARGIGSVLEFIMKKLRAGVATVFSRGALKK